MFNPKGTPSLKMNLQLFAEESAPETESTISTPTEADIQAFNSDLKPAEVETQTESDTPTETENSESTTEQETTEQEPQLLEIKYNHEVKKVTLDEARELAQKGMNLEKAVARAQQEARDQVIADMGLTWNEKPITTEAEYKQAIREQEIRAQYENQNLPPEVLQELVESKRFREQYEAQQKADAETKAKEADNLAFLEHFKKSNGREFDAQKDIIPQSVWDAVGQGKSLTDAYTAYENAQLREQLAKLQHEQKVQKSAPVTGVTGHGGADTTPEDPFLKGFWSVK